MRAILVDREERHPEIEERLTDLYGLPAALGLARPGYGTEGRFRSDARPPVDP
jgi:hypothetical protein